MYERAHPVLPRGYKPYPDVHLGRPAKGTTMAYCKRFACAYLIVAYVSWYSFAATAERRNPDGSVSVVPYGRTIGSYGHLPGTHLASVPPLSERIAP